MISQRFQKAFLENNGILTSQMIKRAGLNVSSIRKASKRGDVERYSHGIYYLNSLYFDDLYLLQLRYPK